MRAYLLIIMCCLCAVGVAEAHFLYAPKQMLEDFALPPYQLPG